METKILKGGAEIVDAIEPEWVRLWEEGGSNDPFLRPEWFRAFIKNFDLQMDLLTVRRDGELRALLPLWRTWGLLHGLPVRKISAVYNLNTPRFDLIHSAKESERNAVIKAVWSEIRCQKGWDLLEFRLVDRNSWLADLIERAEIDSLLSGIWQMDAAPFIELPLSIENVAQFDNTYFGVACRKHLRKELDRRRRRLNELGRVEVKVTDNFSPEVMKTYFEIEKKGWKGRNGTAAGDDSRVARLHADFAEETAANGGLRVIELTLNDKTMAMFINIRYGARTMYWKTSYDEDFRKYSPGNILFREFLYRCLAEGVTEIDMLSPSTENKKFWATGEREHCAFYVFRPGLTGAVLWSWKFGLVARLREMRNRAPKRFLPADAEAT